MFQKEANKPAFYLMPSRHRHIWLQKNKIKMAERSTKFNCYKVVKNLLD